MVVPEMEDDIQDLDSFSHRQDSVHWPEALPINLGITTIKEVLEHKTVKNILRIDKLSTFFDIDAYKNRLNKIWECNHTSTAQGLVTSIILDIATISVTLDQISGGIERA